jgi:hypothetical protein
MWRFPVLSKRGQFIPIPKDTGQEIISRRPFRKALPLLCRAVYQLLSITSLNST